MAEQLLWSIAPSGHVVNVREGDPDGYSLRLARLITVALPDQRVLHANGDLLDCRRANLVVERVA